MYLHDWASLLNFSNFLKKNMTLGSPLAPEE